MSGEAALWHYLSNGMRGRWHVQRHEDRLTAGIPDVSFAMNGIDGWIELKARARISASISLGLSNEQAIWLYRRGKIGSGHCFVMARIGKEHLLFRYNVVNVLTISQSMENLRHLADARWIGSIDFNQFTERITLRRLR
jgi:hypothetical protein